MRNISNLASGAILAILVGAIAIVSVQNATLVSLGLFGWRSLRMPLGTVLAFSLSLGILFGAIAPIIWRYLGNSPGEFDDEDLFEEDF